MKPARAAESDRSAAKQQILAALRTRPPQDAPLPSLAEAWIVYERPAEVFAEVLKSVGGVCVPVADRAALSAALHEIPAYRDARKVCSLVPGIEPSHVVLDEVDDPHALADVDFAVARGEFAIAENGAVWVSDAAVRHRAIYFLPQHLALVVPASEVLSNMHQAYERLSFAERGFGVFISGPSKTADIEQSLVIGAHGAKSLHVFLLEQA